MTSKKKLLIIPGLNQSREIYSFLLKNENISTTFFEFPCNAENEELFKNTSLLKYESILAQFLNGKNFDHILCVSLGAVIFTHLLKDQLTFKRFETTKITMLGPAFSFRFASGLLDYLPRKLFIPSFNKIKFRSFCGCYVWMYQEIKKLQLDIDFSLLRRLSRLEIYYDINDELVSYKKITFLNISLLNSKIRPRHLYLEYINDLAK